MVYQQHIFHLELNAVYHQHKFHQVPNEGLLLQHMNRWEQVSVGHIHMYHRELNELTYNLHFVFTVSHLG